jgi:hypothetical protein
MHILELHVGLFNPSRMTGAEAGAAVAAAASGGGDGPPGPVPLPIWDGGGLGLPPPLARLLLVNMLPRVWVLDGVFITQVERGAAREFVAKLADAPDALRYAGTGCCCCLGGGAAFLRHPST